LARKYREGAIHPISLNTGGRPAKVVLHRLKVLSRTGWNLLWRDLQRDEVTRSCGEVNDLIKGPFGEVKAQNYIARPLRRTQEAARSHSTCGSISTGFSESV
jgi:hypothetical protein